MHTVYVLFCLHSLCVCFDQVEDLVRLLEAQLEKHLPALQAALDEITAAATTTPAPNSQANTAATVEATANPATSATVPPAAAKTSASPHMVFAKGVTRPDDEWWPDTPTPAAAATEERKQKRAADDSKPAAQPT